MEEGEKMSVVIGILFVVLGFLIVLPIASHTDIFVGMFIGFCITMVGAVFLTYPLRDLPGPGGY